MPAVLFLAITTYLSVLASGTTLASLCTASNVEAALPADGELLGIMIQTSSLVVEPLYNQSVGAGGLKKRQNGPGGNASTETFSYCSVNVTYSHTGANDNIQVIYALPDPSIYKSRFYVAGGGGYSLSSSATGGLSYGAAGGATSAGYGALNGISYDDVVLLGNGTINWNATYMFAYQALGEMTMIGKAITQSLYSDSTNSTKVYTYFEGCSDGGREGMSQVQRWPELYDGVIAGAPAFRMAQQQVNHVFSSVVETVYGYYPPPCALEKIVNATIKACDPLDGKTDGVVSRSDLCQLQFNLTSIVGESYSCPAETSTSMGFGISSKLKRQSAPGSTSSYTPAQNGTVTEKDVAVAQAIYNGLHDSDGQRAYLSWQIAAQLADATTQWSNSTQSWDVEIPSTGGEFVTKFVELLDLDNLSSLDGVTYDKLVEWMSIAYYRFTDSLQTTIPDLTTFHENGGKLLHYHGESDPSIPAASSVHYWQSVREVMYDVTPTNFKSNPMSNWYQFYLVPGAAHCGSNSMQAKGPYPTDNMEVMIKWVEQGVAPTRLNATASTNTAEPIWELCQWPLRPLWPSNKSDAFNCVYDEPSYKTWTYSFPAFKVPIY